jgi:DNA-binding ferritin-like protein
MKELMYLLRAMQLYAHNCHNLVKGQSFFSDHGFFGDVYSEVEGHYDSVVERSIGLYGDAHMNLQTIISASASKIVDAPSVNVESNKVYYEYQLKLEERLTDLIRQIIAAGVTPGTEQLIGDIADKSESRKYKIKQRLK